MKAGRVYYKGIAAGTIREDEDGFTFQYDPEYLRCDDAQPVSLTLPLREEPYVSQLSREMQDIYITMINERLGRLSS